MLTILICTSLGNLLNAVFAASPISFFDPDCGLHVAGGSGLCVLVAVGGFKGCCRANFDGDEQHGIARLPLDHGAPVCDGRDRGGAGGLVRSGGRDHVRVSGAPSVRVGLVAAPGHAGLCGGLRIHRFSSVQRPAANGGARRAGRGGPGVPRDPQLGRRGLGVCLFLVPLCLLAGPHRTGRACGPFDGGCPFAGCSFGSPHAGGGLAVGPPGRGRGRCAGADGNAGRFWCVELLRDSDLHGRHLQGLVVHGQPHRRRAAGHHAAGAGGPAPVPGAPGPEAHAFLHNAGRARRGHGRAAGGLGGRCPLAGLAGVWCAGADWFCAADSVHVAPDGGGLVGVVLGAVCGLGSEQLEIGLDQRRAGRRHGHAVGFWYAAQP